LCGDATPTRGLRFRSAERRQHQDWQLVYTCPACGLISAFDARHATEHPPSGLPGSAWTHELRQYHWTSRADWLPQEPAAQPMHFVAALIVSALTWLALTASLNPIDLLWGLAVSLVVARFAYRLSAFGLPRWMRAPRRWLPFLRLLIEFNRQLVVQNIKLSLRVLRPRLNIRPGIVAVPTRLRDDVGLTLLGSLMTLTPDTVTLEIDRLRGVIYVHWIDVQTTDPEQARRLISAGLEQQIIDWLQ
jgi:multicomponent Na+:H+ antiporter subunit E